MLPSLKLDSNRSSISSEISEANDSICVWKLLKHLKGKITRQKHLEQVEKSMKGECLLEDIYSDTGTWMTTGQREGTESETSRSRVSKSTASNSPCSSARSSCSVTASKHNSFFRPVQSFQNTPPSYELQSQRLNDELSKLSTEPQPPPPEYYAINAIPDIRDDLILNWSDISVAIQFANGFVIGHGSFGTVVKAVWRPPNAQSIPGYDPAVFGIPVAVKIMTTTWSSRAKYIGLTNLLARACDEVALVADAEARMGSNRNIIKMYGIAAGPLPVAMTVLFRLPSNTEGVGIIMRYEEGGSLHSRLYNRNRPPIDTLEKVRILCELARGISDIHRVRVVHADLKPANILLSTRCSQPLVRLADFGLSTVRKASVSVKTIGQVSLRVTTRTKGTPIYCAPEMLVNPLEEFGEEKVARPSRKTDMYAFAILAWEVLAETKPFLSIKSEEILCLRVSLGHRPDMLKVPVDTPMVIQDMITACWDKNRAVRKSAIECLAILECQYNMMRHAHVDIYLMSSPSYPYPGFLTQIYRILSEAGYVVQFDRHLHYTVDDTEVKQYVEISEDTKIMVILDKSFQNNTTCIDELTEIITTHPGNKIIPVCVEQKAALSTWMNEGSCKVLKDKMDSHPVFELSDFVTDSWEDDEEVCSDQLYDEFDQKMKPLLQMLRN